MAGCDNDVAQCKPQYYDARESEYFCFFHCRIDAVFLLHLRGRN